MNVLTLKPENSIPVFYAGRSIFITGATGFMGKVLIEKLLRSCPDIQEIFLLMRPKKGISIDDRLRKMLATPALVHVSTSYSQADKPCVEEKIYPIDVDWKKTIKIAENVDDHVLRILTPKYMDSFPNTYTFTKRLAEQVVNDYSESIPSVIFRPSIVISTLYEPVEGWIDNFNGPVGMLVGGGKGLLRVIHLDTKIISDFIPVDVAIKAMLIAAWKRGLQTITRDPSVHVYNCCSAEVKAVSTSEVIEMGLKVNKEIPLEGVLWFPSVTITKNKTLFYFLMIIYHLLPAYFIDGLLKTTGKKPMLVRIQRKVYNAISSLEYFLMNVWKFKNKNFLDLLENLPPNDVADFGYAYFSLDISEYFRNCIIGAKKYLLGEKMENLEEAKIHYERMRWIDKIVKGWFIVFVSWLIFKIGAINYLFRIIQDILDIFQA
ncbi:putative fatty acyl-CoA reductase CG5065 isoform X2 [Leptopilina boulardi]|uniref:putative fatty acyl-CoA reductase CG5065 isoform X2 n=1 Tax=Leptopilina boulardi TaxID=63433 RepID=UPI0021F4FEE7|nr:putative fatty acyl-CoA reductase CG5065 isoform X2 [Leptopilina boulardi]